SEGGPGPAIAGLPPREEGWIGRVRASSRANETDSGRPPIARRQLDTAPALGALPSPYAPDFAWTPAREGRWRAIRRRLSPSKVTPNLPDLAVCKDTLKCPGRVAAAWPLWSSPIASVFQQGFHVRDSESSLERRLDSSFACV